MRKTTGQKEFLEAYDAYADAIFRFCFFRTNDRELAKDLTQETFMKAWGYIEKGGVIKNMGAFLYQLAGNLVIDWYRKKKTESLDALVEDGFELADPLANTGESAEISEMMKIIKKLSRGDQNLIQWRYVEELSAKEIAVILGERENVVSVRLHRAMEKLRKIL